MAKAVAVNAIMKEILSPVEEDVKRYYGVRIFSDGGITPYIVLILGRIWAFFYLGGEMYA